MCQGDDARQLSTLTTGKSTMRLRSLALSLLALVSWGPSEIVDAGQVALQVQLADPTIAANQKQTAYLRIALTGAQSSQLKERPPVNVAIVIDNSGSMQGDKIEQAKQAAIAAVNRLRDSDIVSVVLYNSSVSILVPATKATDREAIVKSISSVTADGQTALFAGVSKGAAEVQKFLSKQSVNRVILLSDGQANVGPSTPAELERLGTSLVKQGISVSTLGLGLGYNEDLMSGLALTGSGNHMFIEGAQDLVTVFNQEFNDLLSVVAGDFKIDVTLAERVRPVKVLGTQANIIGQNVHIPLAELYARQQRYFVLELELEPGEDGSTRPLADVRVQFTDKVHNVSETLAASTQVRFTLDESKISNERDLEAYAYCQVQIANERNRQATLLRDAGQIDEAEKLLNLNGRILEQCQIMCESKNVTNVLPTLELNIKVNRDQAASVKDDSNWTYGRKAMRSIQSFNQAQQIALPSSIDSKP
jgi:Ca-activated chloride channel family protein